MEANIEAVLKARNAHDLQTSDLVYHTCSCIWKYRMLDHMI